MDTAEIRGREGLTTLIEDVKMGDWLRVGPRGIAELLIAHKLKSVCRLAEEMKKTGQDGAPIYKEVVAMCKERRARRPSKRARA
ncbi:hypothetical protein LCGC14_2977700 [marine sediment metagenome]|uniref:Uncharacterized protein n=1 Tax=marine sediment metagenome TaxID=412755 RepID=A0A0F8XUZ6_9ZZZZ